MKIINYLQGSIVYSIIPDSISKTITCYYSKAKYIEANSVVRNFPLFIRDHFKLDPTFFCSSHAIADATEGSWDFETRKFLSSEEKEELARLGHMEGTMMVTKVIFISKDHQQAMGMDDNKRLFESRLTKVDATPENLAQENISILTGSTR